MGNKPEVIVVTDQEKRTFDEALKRMIYLGAGMMEKSLEVNESQKLMKPFRELKESPESLLKKGHILARKLEGSNSRSTGSTGSGKEGDLMHLAIYGEYSGNGKHLIIEKVDPKDGEYCIQKNTVTTAELKDKWSYIHECQYEDTYEMAEFIYKNELDAGYCAVSHNCEHFTFFCLTRVFAVSVQSLKFQFFGLLGEGILRCLFAIFGNGIQNNDSVILKVKSWITDMKIRSKNRNEAILIGENPEGFHNPWCHHFEEPTVEHLLGKAPGSNIHLSDKIKKASNQR